MTQLKVAAALWLAEHPLPAAWIDCTTAVMLKILDGKCKMNEDEKLAIEALYHSTRLLAGQQLGDAMHQLIELGIDRRDHEELDESLKMAIYEQRVLAETMISRPVMKSYKAFLRSNGLYQRLASGCEASSVFRQEV